MRQDKIHQLITYSLVIISIIFFGLRLFKLTNQHAVNVLYHDQWEFLTPLFDNPTIIEMFTKQHGPHRQGIGLYISDLVGYLSNWNTRAESFFLLFTLLIITLVAILLKKRLFGKLTPWDLLIPAITLTFSQIEAIVGTPNPAHGIFPVLLILIICLFLTLENKVYIYVGLVIFTFLTTFTGFGIFIGLITPIILLICLIIHYLKKENYLAKIAGIGFILSLVSFGLFFVDYTFSPAVDCFEFPHPRPLEYFTFISLEFANFFGFHAYKVTAGKIIGSLVFISLILIPLIQLWQIWKVRELDNKKVIIFLLTTFTLLFAVNAAIGRVCLGVETGYSSRYMPLLIPGWLGLYFAAQNFSSKWLSIAGNSILIILLVILPYGRFERFNKNMEVVSSAKRKWVACYLEKENIEECNKVAEFEIHPYPERAKLKEKLDYLKQNHFNLFSDE